MTQGRPCRAALHHAGTRDRWLRQHGSFGDYSTPQSIGDAARAYVYNRLRMQEPKRQFRMQKKLGPMYYLALQIVKKMEQNGYPSRIQEHFRSAERQLELYNKRPRVTKARPWQSPHQFGEAVDIVHKSLYWHAPKEYWEALATAVRVVAAEHSVDLTHGHHWKMVDSAHIELTDWRIVRAKQLYDKGRHYVPTTEDLEARFKQVLPHVALKPGPL